MKKLFYQKAMLAFVFSLLLSACEKAAENPMYSESVTPVLASSLSSVTLSSALASQDVITFTISDPKHAQDTGLQKFVLEMAPSNTNFAKSSKVEVVGKRTISLRASQLNDFVLQNEGGFGQPFELDFRGFSSYGNNNQQKITNTVKVSISPYAVPLSIVPPPDGDLWITGDAVTSGWSNPLSAPSNLQQKFVRRHSYLYDLTITVPGNGGYKLLHSNDGNWGNQYSVIFEGSNWQKGTFFKGDAGAFQGPPSSGRYKFTFNFLSGSYRVVNQ